MKRLASASLCLAVTACAPRLTPPTAAPPAPAVGTKGTPDLLEEISAIVEKNFYSSARLEETGWREAVARARVEFGRARDSAARHTVLKELLASLKTSHTSFHSRDDPAYWFITSLFEELLKKTCPADRLPSVPITYDAIGVFWKQVGSEWFVAGVFSGGPAETSGLKSGDRVISADGRPFSPVDAFAKRAGQAVTLEVQRTRDDRALRLAVVPKPVNPHEELRRASADSFRMIDRGGKRFAYIHLWVWATIDVQRSVLDAIFKANSAAVDGFVIDIRDGWGGADAHYLGIFFRDVPILESISRDGKRDAYDKQIRKPAAVLINGGARSGKETFAYGARKHRLATLVGERTAGAVTFGRPFCLSDGSVLYLAVADARVDGERIEGRGVEPDIEVPFDFRYAEGRDPQLDRALELLATRGDGK